MLLEFEHQKQNKGEYRDFYRVYYIEKTYGVGIYKGDIEKARKSDDDKSEHRGTQTVKEVVHRLAFAEIFK